ncbi:hypothetical protein [Actinomadura citrea]|uniref:AraC-like DNA-binding protein n=1 Tax=Actinomadura citrea TaxID=46158 RepID=A0A7Y9GE50_9ACTN|nr:hypothetical protein [Actinomadura citrea]NYE14878.1 AraC-like DNA-binding protein [Actinomadura citrea]GGU08708.1 hypothetical protein GCM10010177_79820 [Actinomadura citrea]
MTRESLCAPAGHPRRRRPGGFLLTTSLGAIARTVGYKHGETLHRLFARHLATTPERYRQHFATTARTPPTA